MPNRNVVEMLLLRKMHESQTLKTLQEIILLQYQNHILSGYINHLFSYQARSSRLRSTLSQTLYRVSEHRLSADACQSRSQKRNVRAEKMREPFSAVIPLLINRADSRHFL